MAQNENMGYLLTVQSEQELGPHQQLQVKCQKMYEKIIEI